MIDNGTIKKKQRNQARFPTTLNPADEGGTVTLALIRGESRNLGDFSHSAHILIKKKDDTYKRKEIRRPTSQHRSFLENRLILPAAWFLNP